MGVTEETLRVVCGASCFPVGDELLIFTETDQRFHRLNGTAAYIWKGLGDGLSVDLLATELSELMGISRELARADVDSALAQWRVAGLFDVGGGNTEPGNADPVPQRSGAWTWRRLFPNLKQLPEIRFRLMDDVIRIVCCDRHAFQVASALFGHLATSPSPGRNIPAAIDRTRTGYRVIWNGQCVADGLDARELGPVVHAEAMLSAYQRTNSLVVLHAAVIANVGDCVLMPAVSGSGKSTLAAYMAVQSTFLCTDELAILEPDSGCIRPVPLSIGIKAGSWEPLSSVIPGVREASTHMRGDGKQVRYVAPGLPEPENAHATRVTPRAVVFPRYTGQRSACVSSVGPADALCRIAEAGFDTPDMRLTAARAESLVNWVARLECLQIEYGDLRDAATLIQNLLGDE